LLNLIFSETGALVPCGRGRNEPSRKTGGAEGCPPLRLEKRASGEAGQWRMFRPGQAPGKWIERVTFIDFLWRASILMPVSQTRRDRKTSCALLIREKDAQGLSKSEPPVKLVCCSAL